MLLYGQECEIHEDHLACWMTLSYQDEGRTSGILSLIEGLKGQWVSEEEAAHLKALLGQNKSDLVHRYLDLQLEWRSSKKKDDLVASLDLEQELESFVVSPEKSSLLWMIATTCLEKAMNRTLLALSLSPVIKFEKGEDPVKCVRTALLGLVGQEVYPLDFQAKALIEEVIQEIDTSIDPLGSLHRIFSTIEEIQLWQNVLEEVLETLLLVQHLPCSNFTPFEEQLKSLQKQLGQFLTQTLLPELKDQARAFAIGTMRSLFQRINDAYLIFKNRSLPSTQDTHLFCMCHFAEPLAGSWPLNNRVIELPKNSAEVQLKNRDSILIFTCGGGKGHLSVTKAMSEYARGSYHILVANTLEETLASTDVIRKMLLDFSQEKLYNHLLKNEEFEWLKLIVSVGPFFIMLQQENIERQIRLEVMKQRPSMIVSCFPVMNAMFMNVAKQLDIPLLIVTTDLDTSLFTKGLTSPYCDPEYARYRVTLAYEDAEMRKIMEKRIPKERICVTGFPVPPAFERVSSEEEKSAVRRRFEISEDEKVVLIIIGGNAGRATEKYAQIMAQLGENDLTLISEGKPLRVLCLCGEQGIRENRKMLRRINGLATQTPKVKVQGLPAIDAVADLMSISEVLITKPGGCTTNEAIAKGLPMIFHAPFALMDWEVFNMEFAIRAQMGARFRMHSNTVGLFHDGLERNKQRLVPLLKEAFEQRASGCTASFERKNFGEEFMKIVEDLLAT